MSGIKVEKVGPWGSNGGAAFEAISRLTRIKIHHLNAIRALEFQHEINGVLQWSPLLGVHKDSQISEIVLQKDEYLSSISGHTGSSEGYYVVTSLTLISNIRKYGPFGKETGSAFGLPQVGHTKIVGFYGKAGGLLDSIGVYLETYLDFAKEREELSKKLPQVTAKNNAPKDEAKNRIKEREELDKKVNKLTTEISTLKIEAGKHRKEVAKLIEENNSLKARLENTVGPVPYDPVTEGKDTEESFRYVRPVNNIPDTVNNIRNANTMLPEGVESGNPYDPDTVKNIRHANTTQ